MVKSKAATVDEYVAALPEDRRAVITAVRTVVQKNLPEGYRETINWGMIAYEVPLDRYPGTYNKQPLSYAALAAQKGHFALYLNCIDAGSERMERLKADFARGPARSWIWASRASDSRPSTTWPWAHDRPGDR